MAEAVNCGWKKQNDSICTTNVEIGSTRCGNHALYEGKNVVDAIKCGICKNYAKFMNNLTNTLRCIHCDSKRDARNARRRENSANETKCISKKNDGTNCGCKTNGISNYCGYHYKE